MSRKGQTSARRVPVDPSLPPPIDYDCPRPIVADARDLRGASETPLHTHPRGQLIYAVRGTLTTTAAEGNWIAPPERAIWIPAGVAHITRHAANTEVRVIFIRQDAVPGLPTRCAVIQVSPLLREVLLAVIRLPKLYDENGADGRLVGVLLDRVAAAVLSDGPLHLPMPATRKLRAIAVDFAERPGLKLPLTSAARAAAMSPRSFARHFRTETGLAFGVWQRQARLLRALELLGAGASVSDAAFTVGYEGPSAFIAIFRRAFGTTPTRYFEGPK
jgi:AraC-like DNA-binding protein